MIRSLRIEILIFTKFTVFERSSKIHSSPYESCISHVNAVHLRWSSAGSVSTSQIPRTLSIKRRYNWSMSINCASTAYSWILKKIVAQGGAGGAPISVPTFCNQYLLPNWKTFFVMRSLNDSVKTTGGTARFFSFSRANRPMRWRSGTVWIFVYIKIASQIKRRAFDGIFCLSSSFLNVN